MIKNLLIRFFPMLKKRWLIPVLLLTVFVIYFVAPHKSPHFTDTPINPDNAHEINFFALGDQGTGGGDQTEVDQAMKEANVDSYDAGAVKLYPMKLTGAALA